MQIDQVGVNEGSPREDRLADDLIFDEAFYAPSAGIELDRSAAIRHYLDQGEAAGLSPSTEFDPVFYADLYVDVTSGGGSPLLHYLDYGRAEGRYPTRRRLSADGLIVRRSGLLTSQQVALASEPRGTMRLSLIELHIALLWRAGHRLTEKFDDRAYATLVGPRSHEGQSPLNHFIASGFASVVKPPAYSDADVAALRNILDESFYRAVRGTLEHPDPVIDYLTYGRWNSVPAAPDFLQEYYIERYPDIAPSGSEPYVHFRTYGVNEGRIGRSTWGDRIVPGERQFDPGRETILVSSHEASRTGAPLVALAVGEYLARTRNVIYAIGRSGNIEDEFHKSATAIVTGTVEGVDASYLLAELKRDYNLSAAVLNSVETFDLAEGALIADIPSVGLIHEFSEYAAGRIGRMVSSVDRGIMPAKLLLQSAQDEMQRDFASSANNLMIHAQGCLPRLPEMTKGDDLTADEILQVLADPTGERPRIVLGAGFVQMRKGVDLFIQTAAALRDRGGERTCFVWVGHGFDPARDHHYSLWINDMMKRLDLQGTMFFFPPQGSLDTFLELADVFFLSSRLDPFPNVVLDAWEAGRPVVCFREATGVVEWVGEKGAVGAAVGFCDTQAAARAIEDLLRAGSGVGAANAGLMRRCFDFDTYGAVIETQLDEAKRLRARQQEVYERLLATDAFDAIFHEGKPVWGNAAANALKRYVSRATKGLSRINPRPGFSDNLYKSQAGLPLDGHEVALDHAIRTTGNLSPTTHRCVPLLNEGGVDKSFEGRIAIHLHLYYTDLAADFLDRIVALDRDVDLFITTGSGRRRLEIELAFSGYTRGTVQIHEVPNVGRDIGPFATMLGEPIRAGGYALVGHFHGKKSLAVEHIVPGLGARWRSFLVDSLLGTRRHVNQILGLFAADPTLGLVFAEDRNAVGWAGNREIADGLAVRMNPAPQLPSAPFYPLGNMFWARPDALGALWNLGLTWSDYPAEPAPYDGTVLHAIERMLPPICDASGHKWLTVYRPGMFW